MSIVLSPKAKQVIGTVAPFLGSALFGPFGAMAGTIVHAALGTNVGDDKAAEAALLGAQPDTLQKLKAADQDFAVKMRDLGISEERLSFDDLANARNMQVQTKDPTASRLAWMIIGGFIGVSAGQLVGMMGWPDAVAKIPPQGWLLVGNISGYLANEAKQAAAFYFGSTAGSQNKDATIADMAKS